METRESIRARIAALQATRPVDTNPYTEARAEARFEALYERNNNA